MTDATAAMITGKETVELLRFAHEPPRPGCVTIDITLCGICGTDIASFRSGHLHSPPVCGHEWVGTVADLGAEVEGLDAGDRVVVAVPPACGSCPECRSGLGEHCRKVSAVARGRDPLAPPHGGFAPSITVEAARVLHAHPT
jgi:(R,R)-butanediol dehydrogenase/meso-butanediol dehydrogenase/diacetyl reductase